MSQLMAVYYWFERFATDMIWFEIGDNRITGIITGDVLF